MDVDIVYKDCLDVFPSVASESVDLVFADPPYNMSKKNGLGWVFSSHVTMQEAWDRFSDDEFFEFNVKWISECRRVLKSSGSLFICGSYHNIFQIGFILQNMGFRVLNDIIWFKPNAQPNITCRMFTQSTETVLWAVKDKGWKFNYELVKEMNNNKQMRNMWEIPVTKKKEKWAGKHPTQKPLALVERIVLATTDEGDVVLDPFLGSGTTAVVSVMHNRRFIGFEKDVANKSIVDKRLSAVVTSDE